MASKVQVLSLYKSMLRESQKFYSYNFRAYAIRKIRDGFRTNKTLTDAKQIKKEYDLGKDNLTVLTRQVAINNWYKADKLVIENLYNRLNA